MASAPAPAAVPAARRGADAPSSPTAHAVLNTPATPTSTGPRPPTPPTPPTSSPSASAVPRHEHPATVQPLCPKPPPIGPMDDVAERLALEVSRQLPIILEQLLQAGHDPSARPLQLECSLTPAGPGANTPGNRLPVAAVDLSGRFTPYVPIAPAPPPSFYTSNPADSLPFVTPAYPNQPSVPSWSTTASPSQPYPIHHDTAGPAAKRVRLQEPTPSRALTTLHTTAAHRHGAVAVETARKKRQSDNPALQPSTFDKFVHGVWDSLYSGLRVDPVQVIEQWQALESSGQPRLITDASREVAANNDIGDFGRMNILTRKISQTSKTCRSLEVIVQAQWVQCFDDRVAELSNTLTREKAKKSAIAEACRDFAWTEKELRNKTAIWRGYHSIANAAGWAALVFAGTGLYRFCKYRVSFTDETFETLRALRHRFELAADTLHPRWRLLLGIIGLATEPKYKGHPMDWVVRGPGNEALPLPGTYSQWDPNFTYEHLNSSIIDEEAWSHWDPRTVLTPEDPLANKCQVCDEQQADDPTQNACNCYPNLYGSSRPGHVPLQLFRTPDGKNNGLLACCAIENGWAVGEFVGLITSGVSGLDVMVGQTEKATYQIYQGKQGNHTRFVNHSCKPNSQFERFTWLGKQRIVLASLGIEADEEVTVDYGDTYWNSLDKICRCGEACCRYNSRMRQLGGVPQTVQHGHDGDDDDMDDDDDDV